MPTLTSASFPARALVIATLRHAMWALGPSKRRGTTRSLPTALSGSLRAAILLLECSACTYSLFAKSVLRPDCVRRLGTRKVFQISSCRKCTRSLPDRSKWAAVLLNQKSNRWSHGTDWWQIHRPSLCRPSVPSSLCRTGIAALHMKPDSVPFDDFLSRCTHGHCQAFSYWRYWQGSTEIV